MTLLGMTATGPASPAGAGWGAAMVVTDAGGSPPCEQSKAGEGRALVAAAEPSQQVRRLRHSQGGLPLAVVQPC